MTEPDISLLKLLQLSSPTLPVGAFAYSQGLESAIETSIVNNDKTLRVWLQGVLTHSLQQVDIPLFKRLYLAWQNGTTEEVLQWNQTLRAHRETRELRDEDHHLGLALARLLKDLGIKKAEPLYQRDDLCFISLFTLAASEWGITLDKAANGFLWSWLDNQIAAAIKLIPLGQTDGQRITLELLPQLPSVVTQGFTVLDKDIGASLPMLAILSCQHETQYSRLFRS